MLVPLFASEQLPFICQCCQGSNPGLRTQRVAVGVSVLVGTTKGLNCSSVMAVEPAWLAGSKIFGDASCAAAVRLDVEPEEIRRVALTGPLDGYYVARRRRAKNPEAAA
jgi:hypothetical protein